MKRKLTDLHLERYAADALNPVEREQVKKVLAESPADAEALRLLEADTAAFLVKMPAAPFAEKVMPTPKPSPFRLWWGALVAVAAAVSFVVFRPVEQPDIIVKGDVAWKVTASGKAVASGASVREGDTLEFEVTTGAPRWVAVVSHAPDGWFVYVPAMKVETGHLLLPTGAKLDATKGSESLHLLSSEAPFDADIAMAALVKGGAPTGISAERIELTKP
ncbi:MAG: hypothetical protein QM817_32210 [Archangium sp.]